MNNKELVELVKKRTAIKSITQYCIHIEGSNLNEYTNTVDESNVGQILMGPNFLRDKEFIIPLIPEIKFKSSYELLALISTYGNHLYHNKKDTVKLLNNNQELLNTFTPRNKEIYFYVKFIMAEDFSEIASVFNNILAKKNNLLSQKESLVYHMDFNELIDIVSTKSFNFIKSVVTNTFINMESSKEIFNKLKIEDFSFKESRNNEGLDICFISPKDTKLLSSFMEGLISHYANNPLTTLKEEEIISMIDYINLNNNLPERGKGLTKKI